MNETLQQLRALLKIAKDESKSNILRLESSKLALAIINNYEKLPNEQARIMKE